jgi:hypothetical protein
VQYLVEWEPTWIRESDLTGARELIDEFMRLVTFATLTASMTGPVSYNPYSGMVLFEHKSPPEDLEAHKIRMCKAFYAINSRLGITCTVHDSARGR